MKDPWYGNDNEGLIGGLIILAMIILLIVAGILNARDTQKWYAANPKECNMEIVESEGHFDFEPIFYIASEIWKDMNCPPELRKVAHAKYKAYLRERGKIKVFEVTND